MAGHLGENAGRPVGATLGVGVDMSEGNGVHAAARAPVAVGCSRKDAALDTPGEAVGSAVVRDDSDRWWVLHTRARNEKAIAAALSRDSIPHYLPLVQTERRYGKRRVLAEIPLFVGYLFLRGAWRECEAAWKTKRVAKIIRVDNQDKLCGELKQVRQVVESGENVDLYPALKAGRRCRITSGSLHGIEGVVVRRHGVSRVYVAASFVGQSAVIEVDSACVEPIG